MRVAESYESSEGCYYSWNQDVVKSPSSHLVKLLICSYNPRPSMPSSTFILMINWAYKSGNFIVSVMRGLEEGCG